MLYLAIFHDGWLAVAFLLGLGMGWIAVVHRGRPLSGSMLRRIAIVLLAGIVAALLRVIPGRVGYWFDLGLVMLLFYLVGCTIGSWLRERVIARHASAK
jgi:Ca2+/Na+ antiporter